MSQEPSQPLRLVFDDPLDSDDDGYGIAATSSPERTMPPVNQEQLDAIEDMLIRGADSESLAEFMALNGLDASMDDDDDDDDDDDEDEDEEAEWYAEYANEEEVDEEYEAIEEDEEDFEEDEGDEGDDEADEEEGGHQVAADPDDPRGLVYMSPWGGMFRLPADFQLENLRELLRSHQDFGGHPEDIRPQRTAPKKRYFPELAIEPEPAGTALLNSGEFGAPLPPKPPHALRSARRFPERIPSQLLARQLGSVRRPRHDFGHHFLPNSNGRPAVRLSSRAYCGQFSEDGSFFYTCSQDFRVRLYNTSDPTAWEHYKTITGASGRWTITDATLSPDNSKIAYSSITSVVHLASTSPTDDSSHQALDFGARMGGYGGFGIWSLRFSGDGHEIVVGATGGSMYVYDLEKQKTVLGLTGHRDDVNAVCWADESTNVLFSGSDDSLIRVWDRRSMVNERASGVLAGHLEGITFIAPKKDGRYVLSNGKDQTTKLWDIRKLISEEQWDATARTDFTDARYDYREAYYRGSLYEKHPEDVSVMTYASHAIVSTLIRCGFSAADTTGQRYVYSGSHCGRLFIWNLDGTLAKTLNLEKAQGRRRAQQAPQTEEPVSRTGRYRGRDNDDGSCIRDAAWHPSLPVIATTSWHSTGGAIYVHEYMENQEELATQPPILQTPVRVSQRTSDFW